MIGWLTNGLTQALGLSRHSNTWDTLKALKALGHSKGTWALGHSKQLGTWVLEEFGYLKGTWALGHSRNSGTWPLRHLGTRALERHLSTWALEALEALYSAESCVIDSVYPFQCSLNHVLEYLTNLFDNEN